MRLLLVVDHGAAGVLVVGIHGLGDLADRELVLLERQRIDFDLVLLDQAAERRHVGDAGHLQKARRDHPILQLAKLHGIGRLRN